MAPIVDATAVPVLRRAHLVIGLLALVAFIGTGQYMDRVHDHLRGMAPLTRMLFRANHIYFLLTALINIALGLYQRPPYGAWPKRLQAAGSIAIAASTGVLLAAFFLEPQSGSLVRPLTRDGIYLLAAGIVLHIVALSTSRPAPAVATGERALNGLGGRVNASDG